MADIVGTIKPQEAAAVSEAPAWEEPCRILIISDGTGRRHGRIEWLTSEVDEAFQAELAVLCSVAMRARKSASGSPSASA